jgi:hypothetical protein
MKNKITSKTLKIAVLNKYRYECSHYYIASEAGYFNSDIISINNKNEVFEFEIKISKSDLKHDLTKKKHKLYSQYPNSRDIPHIGVPTYFYFVIPECLYEDCKNMLTNYNNYGIIVYNQELNKLYVNKQAKKLHNNKSEVWINKFKRKIVMRMSSELTSLYNKYEK